VIIKNKKTKLRYVLVGAMNTLIDFGLLLTLHSLGLPTLAANIISTTSAFCFSFFANKKFTFKTTGANVKRELVLFVIVTLIGLWGLQNLIIWLAQPLLNELQLHDSLRLIIAKAFASVGTLIWNYVLYSKVVFKKHKDESL
jgi:putative flippase GtrA